MKKLLFPVVLLSVLISVTSQKVSAQYYFYNKDYYDNPVTYELGASLGMMNCLTDLGGKKGIGKKFIKDLNYGNAQFSGGGYLSVTYKNAFAVRVEGTFGTVNAYDSILKDVKNTVFGRYERNLSFQSTISEISFTTEIHPLFIFINWADREQEPPAYSPYLISGIGYYSFNPQAKLNNTWVDLQPLSTEGQGFKEYPDRKPYKLKQTNIPVGVGLRYELSPLFTIRAELVYRILQTDYLDDVSSKDYIDANLFSNYFTGTKLTNALLLQDRRYELDPNYIHTTEERGNPNNKDGFFTLNVKLGLTFGRQRIRK